MSSDNRLLRLELTLEEALELFEHCLSSTEPDTPAAIAALRKLGDAIEQRGEPKRRAS